MEKPTNRCPSGASGGQRRQRRAAGRDNGQHLAGDARPLTAAKSKPHAWAAAAVGGVSCLGQPEVTCGSFSAANAGVQVEQFGGESRWHLRWPYSQNRGVVRSRFHAGVAVRMERTAHQCHGGPGPAIKHLSHRRTVMADLIFDINSKFLPLVKRLWRINLIPATFKAAILPCCLPTEIFWTHQCRPHAGRSLPDGRSCGLGSSDGHSVVKVC